MKFNKYRNGLLGTIYTIINQKGNKVTGSRYKGEPES